MSSPCERPEPFATPEEFLADFPELRKHACPALRLHPHLGEPTRESSSAGGPLLWPTEEPWPTCSLPHYVATPCYGENGLMFDTQEDVVFDEPVALQPVLQLFARDLPQGYSLPHGAEVLQVLWCPNEHSDPHEAFGHHYGPSVALRWRSSPEVTDPLAQQPQPHTKEKEYDVPACELAPEPIMDYPDLDRVPEELAERVMRWKGQEFDCEEEPERHTYFALMMARRGMKLGGCEGWEIEDPFPMTCSCGTTLEHLVQIDSMEGPALRNLIIGRAYALNIYYCPASLEHPYRINIQ
ncbi:hypothetical protein [Salinactinospora qingdaonensis]|uniref:DUF1963 domain-containing protein n=1 Tax=Salinactinospora qingdaonensis TaxID=702744 RepID=A0ABP7FIW4_9ACTN